MWRDEATAGALVSPYPKTPAPHAPSHSSPVYQHQRHQQAHQGKSILKRSATSSDSQDLSPNVLTEKRLSSIKDYAVRLNNRQAVRKEQESSARWVPGGTQPSSGFSPNSRTI